MKKEQVERTKFINKNKNEEEKKIKMKENLENQLLKNKNIFETYPRLQISLDDLLQISKKISIEKTDVPILWEYFLRLNTHSFFDYLKLKTYEKKILNNNENQQKANAINELLLEDDDHDQIHYFNDMNNQANANRNIIYDKTQTKKINSNNNDNIKNSKCNNMNKNNNENFYFIFFGYNFV